MVGWSLPVGLSHVQARHGKDTFRLGPGMRRDLSCSDSLFGVRDRLFGPTWRNDLGIDCEEGWALA